MNTKFEKYSELVSFDMIDTYYDDIKDFKYLIDQLQEDRVESQKYIVSINKKLERYKNIVDGMEKFFQYAYDNEVRPLNDRKVSVWTICLDKLKELKGSDD